MKGCLQNLNGEEGGICLPSAIYSERASKDVRRVSQE